jgi:cobalt-zinc-cadmium efflux system protein
MPAHARGRQGTGWVLKVAAPLTLAFCGIELAAGHYAHSLALRSDAWHNLSDALALIVTWFASFYAQSKGPNQEKTYGYQRAGVLAAFLTAPLVLIPVGLILYRGSQRLMNPGEPNAAVMLAVGAAAICLNGAISGALHRALKPGECPRSVFIHMAGDALAGLGIVAAALFIRVAGWRLADPILAMLIAGLVVWTVWDVMAECLDILLEGLPRGLALDEVEAAIRAVPLVEDVHDLHVWSLGPVTRALSCHVRIPPLPFSEGEAVLNQVNALLESRFRIRHTTLQLECQQCEAANGCIVNGPRVQGPKGPRV